MQITMYSTSSCAVCQSLGKWLEQNGQTYTKKITDTDPAVMEEFLDLSEQFFGVPFTVVIDDEGNTTKIRGFDRKAFTQVLGI